MSAPPPANERREASGAGTGSLSRVGLGTVPLGNLYHAVTDEQAYATVDAAWEVGIRSFDTAPVYGYGLAERRLGAALLGRPRGDYRLSTKVGRLLAAGIPDDPALASGGRPFFVDTPAVRPKFDFSYDATLRSLEESIERLGVDRIDTVYIHDPDDHFTEAMEGAYRALHELREAGVIAAIGVGMTQVPMLARFAREGDFDVFLLAGRYSLLDTSAADELLPLCTERKIDVVVGGVFNSGILASADATPTFDYKPAPEHVISQVRRINEVCTSYGVPLGSAAIQFPLRHPAVNDVLLGMRSPSEVRINAELARQSIPEQLWAELAERRLLGSEESR